MSNETNTAVPQAASGAKLGWTVVVLLMIVGMVVAYFTLDAGKVYVETKEQSYTQYSTSTAVDMWVPIESGDAREAMHQGAVNSGTRVISTIDENDSLAAEAGDSGYSSEVSAQVRGRIETGASVEMVHLTGTTTSVSWLPTDEAPEEGMSATGEVSKWNVTTGLPYNMPAADRPENSSFSVSRTVGLWLAAILTLAIMSFLCGDNPFYKTAEAILVGSSAGYAMAYAFYTGIVDQLLINLFPAMVREWTSPGLPWSYSWDWVYVIPAILAVMLVCRLLPKGGWIARWPLAFIIGATAGFRLTSHLESDFLLQIKGTITTLWAENANGQFDLWNSVGAIVILVGVLLCLVYFFFSLEHKGAVGKAARGGIFVLMITFGAAFGLTVMGRITLLTERFDFLFKEWLHLM
ncbi:MAG: hypothetical protein MK089_01835 [Phycisphaerales bacterium]|nr:hypothetical protein [Phycisphaerales bacterium]